MSRFNQWLVDHSHAILATVVFMQNFTPFGRDLKVLMQTIGLLLTGVN